jgi:hypothetical protein
MTKIKTIQKKEKKFQIGLSKKLYTLNAIESAANEFKEISQIAIETKKNSYLITISPNGSDNARLIGYEFCNYVIGLMKEKNIYD